VVNSNFANAPANIIVWSQTFYAHIAGGTTGVTNTGIIEGAVVSQDTSDTIPMNGILPSGAADAHVQGVCTDKYETSGSAGAAEGKPINVARIGVVGVNLAASTAVTKGDKLITANASGDVKPRTNETGVVIVGEAMETVGAQTSRGRISCRLMLQFVP